MGIRGSTYVREDLICVRMFGDRSIIARGRVILAGGRYLPQSGRDDDGEDDGDGNRWGGLMSPQ